MKNDSMDELLIGWRRDEEVDIDIRILINEIIGDIGNEIIEEKRNRIVKVKSSVGKGRRGEKC